MTDKAIDGEIKRVVIPSRNFINRDIVGENLVNFIRYRVITEDKNAVSAWSPIYKVKQTSIPTLIGSYTPTISVSSNLDTASFTWNTPVDSSGNLLISLYAYDVYVRWYSGNTELTSGYTYVGSVNYQKNNTFSVTKPSSANKVSVMIQASTYPKQINANAKVSEITSQNV